MRKSWDEYFLDIAFKVAERSTCPRRAVGAVVVKDKRIKGTGYNGAPHGLPHCIEAGCILEDGHCRRSIHAEINALLECSPEERRGATLYITDYPCENCALVIVQSGIRRVVYARDYPVKRDWLREAGIEVVHLPREGA
ncbi:MAG TPA: deaminase [Moorella mulderi]|nr:deaminase [Moorella mulderi]